MVTDQEISQALQSVIHEASISNDGGGLTTLHGVVQQLESKLGVNLSHKADFIWAQIHLLFRSHPTQQTQQQRHHHPHQNHSFHPGPSPSPSAFQSFSVQAPPAKPEAAAANEAVAASELPKESTQTKPKRKGGPGGLNKLCGVSPELQAIVGQPTLPRTELWVYIRRNNLQDPSNKRKIICNDELRLVFETDCTDMFKMNKLLSKHIIPLEPSKQPAPKKAKVDVEAGAKTTEASPSVVISDALANFFGISEREMLQAEVLKRIWEYIKVNNLEDPMNQMAILCDSKLQELFGCQSISALGIPEVLARRHIFKKP